jgi:hypothetical protein
MTVQLDTTEPTIERDGYDITLLASPDGQSLLQIRTEDWDVLDECNVWGEVPEHMELLSLSFEDDLEVLVFG